MSAFEKRLEAIKRFTPTEGYNVVGVDSYEPPGEELFLIAHYDTEAEAQAEVDARLEQNPEGRYYIYNSV